MLHRLQAQTLPNATPPILLAIDKIHHFSKMAADGILILDYYDIVYFITGRAISNCLGMTAPYLNLFEEKGDLLN